MGRMRRAVLAILLCAAPLTAAPAYASNPVLDGEQLRAVGDTHAIVPLSLHYDGAASPAASAASVARAKGPVRVLVGLRDRANLAAVAQELRDLGATPQPFDEIGVLAATVPDGAALTSALAGDPRVAYVERDATYRIAVDPFDNLDTSNNTGLKYTWAYDDVKAAAAIAAAGGGSRRTIAVMDTGVDLTHPDLAGRIAGRFDTASKGRDVTDTVGHGTFVTGLIAAIDGNGIGGKGVAGNTKVLAVRASRDGDFTTLDLLRGIEYAIRRHADVLNMSLAGGVSRDTPTLARALALAFVNDILPIAASGNTGSDGNAPQFPAAVLGGSRGAPGIGLSVAATKPNGQPAGFSTRNRYVSLSAPGAMDDCTLGVFSTLPAYTGTEWDVVDPGTCPSEVFTTPGSRYGYGQGTSFAAPIVSGIAALTWQVEPRLASEQVADVLIRSADQRRGRGWNKYTGSGVVDGAAAVALARRFDVISPKAKGSAHRTGASVSVRLKKVKDRTEPGRELAGHVRYGLLVSRDAGRDYDVVVSGRHRAFHKAVRLRGRKANVFVATACDSNGNCGVKRLGRFKR
jgi:subtilisin family serine protease